MCSRTLARWILSAALAVMMLGVVLLTLNQVPISQSHPLATDYTVGGTCGATIQACINNPMVQASDRILIPAGDYTASLTLNKAVSLIGSGSSTTIIHALSNQRVMTVTGAAITASVVISGLTFTGGYLKGQFTCPIDCGAGILITDTASPLLANVVITDNFSDWMASGLYAEPGGVLTLLNVEISSNTTYANLARGAFISGTLAMINGRFADNLGGGLSVEGGAFLTRTEFIGNQAGSGGGARITGIAEFNGGRFENNHSTSNSSEFGGGGGLYIFSGTLKINGTTFVGNTSGSYGGGLTFSGAAAIIHNGIFSNNHATYYGGGLIAGAPLTLYQSQFSHNTAQKGGGLFTNWPLTIYEGVFENNGVQAEPGRHSYGGGLIAGDLLVITNTRFVSNTAEYGGAIVHSDKTPYLPAGNGRIVNTVFARNTADYDGAALYLDSAGVDVILHTTIADVSLNPKQAITVLTGTVGMTDTIITHHAVAISQTEGTVYQDYNLFFGNTITETGAIINGGHSVNGNPNFASPAIDDFHIISPSAAMGAGVYAGILIDIDNEPRPMTRIDIGADEYWAPGALKHIYLPLVLKNH